MGRPIASTDPKARIRTTTAKAIPSSSEPELRTRRRSAAEPNREPGDLWHQLDLGADDPGFLECDVVGDADLCVGDEAGLRPLRCDLLAPFGGVRADESDSLDLARLIEEFGHRRLDLRVGHALLGPEHDGPSLAPGGGPGEMLVEDVETASAFDVGERKLGAVGGTDHRVGEDAAEHESSEPAQGDFASVAKTPTSKGDEQKNSFGEGARDHERWVRARTAREPGRRGRRIAAAKSATGKWGKRLKPDTLRATAPASRAVRMRATPAPSLGWGLPIGCPQEVECATMN